MNPFRFIAPDPLKHSGHLKLQLLVSSRLIAGGIPATKALPRRLLIIYEQPIFVVFKARVKNGIIRDGILSPA